MKIIIPIIFHRGREKHPVHPAAHPGKNLPVKMKWIIFDLCQARECIKSTKPEAWDLH